MPAREPEFIRFERSTTLKTALDELERRKLLRSAQITGLYATLKKLNGPVAKGTYSVNAGMEASEILAALNKPVRRMVRIPEGWWIARTAKRLEEEGVCKAQDYVKWASEPQFFQDQIRFKLPASGTLEGYLYPDTYDLPPLIEAKEIVRLQLQAFQSKVVDRLGAKNLGRTLTIASMVEAETAKANERPVVAGVIENRLRKSMRLEIDATVLYGLQDWRVLGPGEVRKHESPYNTYLHEGLPPGPIGSPSFESIKAAFNPAHHDYLFYVALPNRTHLFAHTYEEQKQNIRRRKAALGQVQKP